MKKELVKTKDILKSAEEINKLVIRQHQQLQGGRNYPFNSFLSKFLVNTFLRGHGSATKSKLNRNK